MSKFSKYMNTNITSIHPEDKIRKVLSIFREKKVTELFVTDTENKVIGIISYIELLKYFERKEIVLVSSCADAATPYDHLLKNGVYKKSLKEYLETDVKTVMSKKVYAIKELDSLHKATKIMKKKDYNCCPLLDCECKLQGIIARNDLLELLIEQEK